MNKLRIAKRWLVASATFAVVMAAANVSAYADWWN